MMWVTEKWMRARNSRASPDRRIKAHDHASALRLRGVRAGVSSAVTGPPSGDAGPVNARWTGLPGRSQNATVDEGPQDDHTARETDEQRHDDDGLQEPLLVAHGLGEQVDGHDPQPVERVEHQGEQEADLEEAQEDVAVEAVDLV